MVGGIGQKQTPTKQNMEDRIQSRITHTQRNIG